MKPWVLLISIKNNHILVTPSFQLGTSIQPHHPTNLKRGSCILSSRLFKKPLVKWMQQ
jgi:hypothetical protein